MAGNPFVIKMIESKIDKSIDQIKINPQLGMKNLAQLAKGYAKNPEQKDLFKKLETLVMNPSSPYYNIIPSLVQHVNQQTLKTFIINASYKSKFYGDKKPGISAQLIFATQVDEFSHILEQNPHRAYVVFLPPAAITSQNIAQIKSYDNAFFLVLYDLDMDMAVFQRATQLLFENQSLFGSYSFYDSDEMVDFILSNQWINDIVMTQSPFGILIESDFGSPEKIALVKTYIENTRLNPQYPVILIDFHTDLAKLDNYMD